MRIRTTIFLSSSSLKITAVLMAYFLWSMLSDLYVINTTIETPVTIEKAKTIKIKKFPRKAKLTLSSHRKNIRSLKKSDLVLKIKADQLKSGKNYIRITNKHLSLPSYINIVDYEPADFSITAMETPKPSSNPVSS